MNATDGSCRLSFFPTSERKIPSGRARGWVLQKTKFAANNTSCYLPKCKYVLPARGIFPSRTFREIRLPFAGHFYECRSYLKNRHEYPVTFHAAKLCWINNTLYINRDRQDRTQATTPRKYSSSMKKKAFICPRIWIIEWLKLWFFSVMFSHGNVKIQAHE